jgi:hypothetical protein
LGNAVTSAYRRDHITSLKNDEFERLDTAAQADIIAAATAFEALYPVPVASNGERIALKRAMARFLIDSGKASLAGVV